MPQDPESEAELKNLAAVPYQIVSPANNSSIIGIYQDSMLGSYQFTREGVRFSPRDAMNILMMFNGVNEHQLEKDIKKDGGINNFDIMSQIMPPLSMRYKTKAFKDDKDDIKNSNNVIEIQNGKYIRGQMDKSVMGARTKGLLQRVCNDFGNMSSSKFVDDLQNVVTEYMNSSAFSVGISDLISNQSTNDEIIQVITKKKTDVKNLIDQVQIGIFENNTGKTNEEEFETQVNSILNQATSESGKIGLKSLGKNNRFVIMVNAGSKGSDLNISQMVSCLGQQNVDGKRIPYGFENRTLPHFTKYDDSPGARGFVESSYINGLSPQELFFHAMGGRVGLIDTAVKSVTWETKIIIIENEKAKYIEIGKWIDTHLDKCLPEQVQHFTERQMELLNMNNGDIFIPTTDENGKVTWGEVTAITRHDPGTELYEIKTTGGRKVIVTESKSLLIWNSETKKLKETPTPEIKVGDCVPVTRELCSPPVIITSINMTDYFPKTEFIYGTDFNKAVLLMQQTMNNRKKIPSNWWIENNGTQFELPYTKKASLQRMMVRINSNKENIKDGFIYPYNGNRKDTSIPESFVLNEENGCFIGLFLAEGNVNKNVIYITNNDVKIRSFVKQWFDKYSIKWTEKQKINKIGGTTTTICGASSILALFLTKLVGHGAANKHVPSEAFISQESFIIGIINGYYSGDGTISKNSVDIGSASERLIEGITMLLSRLGIFGKVFKTQLKSNNLGTKNIKPSFRLSIRAQWGKIFTDKISLLEESKRIKINNIKWREIHRNFDTYNDVVLDKIIEINIIGVENHPKVYDLTIPSTLNFGLANGLQVRDTSTTGYIQRRLIKGLEDLMVSYDMTVRTNKNKIVQFSYGEDNIDTIKVEDQNMPIVTMSTQDIYAHYLVPEENTKIKTLSNIFLKNTFSRYKKQNIDFMDKTQKYIDMMIENRERIIKYVFKNKSDSSVSCPVAFYYIINNIQGQCNITMSSLVDITLLEALEMIEHCYSKLEQNHYAPPTELFKTLFYYYLSPKDLLIVKRFNMAALTLLLDTIIIDYKRAIVAPGEMIGMIAGQSIGEVSTQMSVPFNSQHKIVSKNKSTGEITFKSIVMGEFCDKIIKLNPELTFNTGHKNSVETIIETLENEYYIIGVSEDEKTSWNKISHISKHPVNGQLMTVFTKSGRVVETTTSHSHLIRENHKVVPIIGINMKEGMRIPICGHISNSFIKNTFEDIILDNLFGWFIGAYLAEGNLNYNEISITNISEYYIENTKKIAGIFGKECRVVEKQGEFGKSITTKFNCEKLAKLLLNTCGNGSFVKKVPDFAFTAPDEFKKGMFQGYFDGDGNFQCDAKHHQIRCCSRSEQLMKDMALILNYFDIVGNLKTDKNKGGSCLYHLNISSKYAKKYQTQIGSVLHVDKLDNLVKFTERNNISFLSEQIDKISGMGTIVAYCGKTLKLDGQSRTYGFWKNKETIGRRTLEKYYNVFNAHTDKELIKTELNLIEQAITSNVMWDEIINIEYHTPNQTDFVYDFTIPSTQTFMTDYGVIVHNTLNTFHFAGVASKSNVTRGVPRIEEILSLSTDIKNPSLSIYLKAEDEKQKEKAQTIMYMLEHTRLEEIVKSIEVCFDPDDLDSLIIDDKDTIEQYKAFENMIAECNETSLQSDENEKSKWIIRMVMDPEVMLEKNITMDDVNYTLKNCYDEQINCIYSDFNSDKLIFRIRMTDIIKSTSGRGGSQKKAKVNPLDQSDQIYILKNFQDQLLQNVVLRGIKGINKVILRKIVDNMVEQNGIYKKQDIWVLDTIGTNLLDVLGLDFIDNTRTVSNSIVEIYNVLGIEAARQTIYNELVEVVEFDGTYINYHNYSVLVDRMSFTHKLISIFRHGINNDNIGPIAKASFEETPEMFLKAARHAELDTMRGISANVMCGQEGLFGTAAFQVILDIEEMQKLEAASEYKLLNVEDAIEQFFGNNQNDEDPCSYNKISIQNNVITIKGEDMGNDNNYNPGF